jgi:TRAP-type C4-dicarboxylate transport system substrate-binding protein
VPEGSIWDKNLRQMGDEWRRGTDGRVSQRLPGRTAGRGADGRHEDATRRAQAASLTILGLAQIDDGFNVFAVPFFYDSYAEAPPRWPR